MGQKKRIIMSNFFRIISNLIYFTIITKRKYQKEHLDEKVILCDASKAVKLPINKDPEYGKEWITSRRCSFILSNKSIKAGDWNIHIHDISRTELIKFNSLYGKGMVLKIRTINDENYQFGMQYNKIIEEQKAIKINEIRDEKLKKSLFSKVIRMIAIGYIIYMVIDYFIMSKI